MAEQLELFDDSDFPPKKEGESADFQPPPTHSNKTQQGKVYDLTGYDEKLTLRAKAFFKDFGLSTQAEEVRVIWNKRMRSTAGRAHYQKSLIDLNPHLQLLPEPQKAKEIEGTFLHELAHLVAFGRNRGRRIRPHGIEWKQACVDLGIPGEDRCHNLELKTRRMKKKFIYECPVCHITIPRVKRIKQTVACLPCCRKHNRGKFDSRFRLEETPLV